MEAFENLLYKMMDRVDHVLSPSQVMAHDAVTDLRELIFSPALHDYLIDQIDIGRDYEFFSK